MTFLVAFIVFFVPILYVYITVNNIQIILQPSMMEKSKYGPTDICQHVATVHLFSIFISFLFQLYFIYLNKSPGK